MPQAILWLEALQNCWYHDGKFDSWTRGGRKNLDQGTVNVLISGEMFLKYDLREKIILEQLQRHEHWAWI